MNPVAIVNVSQCLAASVMAISKQREHSLDLAAPSKAEIVSSGLHVVEPASSLREKFYDSMSPKSCLSITFYSFYFCELILRTVL